MKSSTRYVIARICLTSEGKWSADVPQPSQGGALDGLGTVTIGEGDSLQDLLDYISSNLHRNTDEILNFMVKGIEK